MENLINAILQLRRERHLISLTKEERPNIAVVQDVEDIKEIERQTTVEKLFEKLENKQSNVTWIYVTNNGILLYTEDIDKKVMEKMQGKKKVRQGAVVSKFQVIKVTDKSLMFTTQDINDVFCVLKSVAYIKKILNQYMIQYSTYMQRFSNIVILNYYSNNSTNSAHSADSVLDINDWIITHSISKNKLEKIYTRDL